MLYIDDDRVYITRGDDASLDVTLTTESGDAYEMQDGDVLTLTVRRTPADTDAVARITSASAHILIGHEDTAEAAVGEYSADIQLLSGGKRITIWPRLSGINRRTEANFRNFVIMPEVTKE